MTDETPKTLMNAHELAAFLTEKSPLTKQGQRDIGTRLVNSWWDRRAVIGFPEAVGKRADRARPAKIWDAEEVLEWFVNWEPKRGGAPRGNRNGVKHGRFVGVRAAEAAKRAGKAAA